MVYSRPTRMLVALVTALWTSLACCCALGGHTASAATAEVAPTPAGQTTPAGHGCCTAPADPADSDSDSPAQGASHDCACGGLDRLAEHQAEVRPLIPVQPLLAAFDFALAPLTAWADDVQLLHRPLESADPAQPNCAPSLVGLHCQLTI